MIDGRPIPRNFFFIGAINPPTIRQGEEREQTTLVQVESAQDFIVKQMPPSMDVLILKFGTLTPSQERSFLKLYLDSKVLSRQSNNAAVSPSPISKSRGAAQHNPCSALLILFLFLFIFIFLIPSGSSWSSSRLPRTL
jgi:hypothetical protein